MIIIKITVNAQIKMSLMALLEYLMNNFRRKPSKQNKTVFYGILIEKDQRKNA